MNPAQVAPFHAISLSRQAHRLQAAGRSIIHMEFGQPSFGAPPKALAAAKAALEQPEPGYWESEALRQKIAGLYASRYGVVLDPERIILTAGASPALVLALSALFAPQEKIAFVRPGYVAYRNTVAALGRTPVEIEADARTGFQLSADHLRALAPDVAGVILASPANPTGTMIAPAQLAEIAEVARTRGLRLIADEIYHGLCYEAPAQSLLAYEDRAIVISSFSKYFAMPGWRLGWMVVPLEHVAQIRAYIGNLFLTPPAIAQLTALGAFEDEAVLQDYVASYARNRLALLEALPQMGLTKIAPPDGAFYIWADVSHLTEDSFAFCMQLLEDTGIAIAPGIDFDPVNGHRFIRFSFAVREEELQQALARLGPWLAAYSKN